VNIMRAGTRSPGLFSLIKPLLVATGVLLASGIAPPALEAFDCADFIEDINFPDGTPVQPGQTFLKGWRLQNCGSETWSTANGYDVRRIAGDYGPLVFDVPVVPPGGVGDFWATVTAPTDPGIHQANYRIHHNGVSFQDGFWVNVEVVTGPSVDCADFIEDINFPDGTQVQPGETFLKGWRLQNCSTETWSAANGYDVRRISGDYGPLVFDVPVVPPGGVGDFWATVTAPSDPGIHQANYRIHHNGVSFQDGFWVNVEVVGGPGGDDQVCPTSLNPGGFDVVQGGSFIAEWQLENCGTTTWDSNSYQAVRTSSAAIGPATASLPSTVSPGASIVLSIPMQANAAPGSYDVTYRLNGPNGSFDFPFAVPVNVLPAPAFNLSVSPTSLGMNSEGWPTPNPVIVDVHASCPGACSGNLTLEIGLLGANPRFYLYETTSLGGCQVGSDDPGDRFSATAFLLNCPLSFPNGGSASYSLKLWVQPSAAGNLPVTATWQGEQKTEQVSIPQAQIHPLVFIHGVLGSMPPQELLVDNRATARDVFDPFLGHYRPLLDTLVKMGYVWNESLFGVAYDWRKSNAESGNFLKSVLAGAVIPRSSNSAHVASDPRADLVVHSMGGLVSRSYIQGSGWAGDVRKVVFVASPHKGFPFDYRTWEGGTWFDYVYNAPIVSGSPLVFIPAMDRVIWPTLVAKRYNPSLLELGLCSFFELLELIPPIDFDTDGVLIYRPSPIPGLYLCNQQKVLQWMHSSDPTRGIGSLREMLPTEDMEPYLLNPLNDGPFPFGHEVNGFLENLNANIGVLGQRLGTYNIYVLAGNGAPQTDRRYRVFPPPLFSAMWNYGEALNLPFFLEEQTAGDDLIPLASSTLSNSGLLPLPAGHEVILNAAPNPGGARHSPIMHHDQTQRVWIPGFLADLNLPFKTDYAAPWIPSELYEIVTVLGACPVNLMVTDPQGRRLGYDPVSQQVVQEIPFGFYSTPDIEPQILWIAAPIPGEYTVTVTGWGQMPGDPDYSIRVDRIGGAVGFVKGVGGTSAPLQEDSFTFDLVPNAPPMADAGGDQFSSAGEDCTAAVTLDGSASFDPDGDALTYEWVGAFGTLEGERVTIPFPLGTYEITLTVDDGKGQTATDTVVVTVEDQTPPLISVPETITAEQTSLDGTPLALPEPGVTDNCELESVVNDAPSVFPLGLTVVTYTATDAAGNVATASTNVIIEDTTPPVLQNVPAPVTVEQTSLAGAPVELALPTATDICDAAPIVESDAPLIFPLGSTVVTFTATDASGNVGTATTTVTVVDTTPPVLTNVPEPVSVEQTSRDGAPVELPLPTANDICDALPLVESNAPSVFPLGTTTVTFTATDDSGNVATATTTVTVVDTTPPRIDSVRANPATLWPPNHKLVPVRVIPGVFDVCDAAPACRILSVSSSEPVTGKGDNTSPDWEVTGDLSVDLRAERSGNGNGRVYTVKVECVDDSGNASRGIGTVKVPHDQGGN
jgi:hypothetical protein